MPQVEYIICKTNLVYITDGYQITNLTIGKRYSHIETNDLASWVNVIDDMGNMRSFSRSFFMTLDEFRNRKIDKVLN